MWLWRDGDMVSDLNRSRREPGGALGRFPLGAGPHASVWLDLPPSTSIVMRASSSTLCLSASSILVLTSTGVEHSFVSLSIQLGCNPRANLSGIGERLRLASNPGAQPR